MNTSGIYSYPNNQTGINYINYNLTDDVLKEFSNIDPTDLNTTASVLNATSESSPVLGELYYSSLLNGKMCIGIIKETLSSSHSFQQHSSYKMICVYNVFYSCYFL